MVADLRLLPVLALLTQAGVTYGLSKLFFRENQTLARAAAVVYGTLPIVLISASTSPPMCTWLRWSWLPSTVCCTIPKIPLPARAEPAVFNEAKSWWFYVVLALAARLPWSALLLAQTVRTGWAALPLLRP